MRSLVLATALFASGLILSESTLAVEAAAQPAVGQPTNGEDSPVAVKMKQMGKQMKTLKEAMAKETKDAKIIGDAFTKLGELATATKDLGADFAKTDEQKKSWAEYLDGVVAESKKGADAAKAAKWDDVTAANNALKALKEKAHKAFIPDEK